MNETIKRKIQFILGTFGYSIKRVDSKPLLDLRYKHNDPRLFLYYGKKPLFINVRIELGRIRFFPLSKKTNPFVYAVSETFNEKDTFNVLKSCLQQYYSLVQPENAYDWFGLEKKDTPLLSGVPAWFAPEPWEVSTVDQKRRSMERVSKSESKKCGKKLSASHGSKVFGPVTSEKLHTETVRFHKTMLSIESSGFCRHDGADGDIEALVFVREDGQWRWQVSRGLHRLVVLTALCWRQIPLRVKNVVYRQDADTWPNVLSGLYTKDGALKLFDRIFDGELPALLQRWIKRG